MENDRTHFDDDGGVVLERMRTVPEVINTTFDFIRYRFPIFSRSLLKIALPPTLIAMILFGWGYSDVVLSNFAYANPFGTASGITGSFLFWIVTIGLLFLSSSIIVALVYEFMAMHRDGELDRTGDDAVGVQEIWERTRANLGKAAGSIIVYGIGLAFALGVGMFFLGFASTAFVATLGEVGLVFAIPIYLFGIFGIVAFMMLYLPARFFDDRGVLQSFIVSSRFVSGRWMSTTGLCVVLYLLSLALTLLFYLPVIVAMVLGELGVISLAEIAREKGFWYYFGVAFMTLYMSAYTLVSVVPMIAAGVHYLSQTERTEGRRLRRKIEQMMPVEGAEGVS